MTATKTATTWDLVCSANQHLDARSAGARISQFFPGKYELITSSGVRVGHKMDDQTVRAFISQAVFKEAPVTLKQNS
jgi:hypothetical protein